MSKKIQKENNPLIEAIGSIFSEGITMRKLVKAEGLFWNATYDERKVATVEQLLKLDEEGYRLQQDFGWMAMNILLDYHKRVTQKKDK